MSSLTGRAVRGAAWTLPTSLASRGIGLAGTLLLARYLAPAEYGEVSAAAILTVTASSVTTFGVGMYLVTNHNLSRDEIFHVTCWFLGVGAAAVVLALALSGPLGAWSGIPNLTRFMPILAVSMVLERILYVPERMLVRKLRFGWLSIARAFGELTYTSVSISLAVHGFGAMAIAWGSLSRSAVRFLAIVPAVDRREWLEAHRLRLSTMLSVIGYGMNISLAGIASFGMRRWDNLLVSRYFGPAVMGAYNYAYNLADTPAVAIGEQISDVIGASFPHVQQENRAAALIRSCTMISMIMFPLAFGLGAVAPTLVQTFFNQQWAQIGTMLVFLSVLSAPRPVAETLIAYLYACKEPRVVIWLEWLSLTGLIVALSTVGRIGITWTCGAVGAVFVLRAFGAVYAVHRLHGIPVSSFLLPLTRPLLASVAMVIAVVGIRPTLVGLAPSIQLATEVTLGAFVYLAGALLIARTASRDLLKLLRSALVRVDAV